MLGSEQMRTYPFPNLTAVAVNKLGLMLGWGRRGMCAFAQILTYITYSWLLNYITT